MSMPSYATLPFPPGGGIGSAAFPQPRANTHPAAKIRPTAARRKAAALPPRVPRPEPRLPRGQGYGR
jgi:hypothetical protein